MGHMIVLLQYGWPKQAPLFSQAVRRLQAYGTFSYSLFFSYIISILTTNKLLENSLDSSSGHFSFLIGRHLGQSMVAGTVLQNAHPRALLVGSKSLRWESISFLKMICSEC